MEEFINDALTENTNEDEVPGGIQHALNYYQESNALGKMVIIALLDHHKYSKEFIMEFFWLFKTQNWASLGNGLIKKLDDLSWKKKIKM